MEQKIKRRAPPNIKSLSGIFKRALPMKGLRRSEETLALPIKMPISVSEDPNLAR
jgi:hypothetical protein